MKVCWVKIWIASMATLTERFRDDEGRVDFEALGREEYAFRHALITGDYYKSERARDLAEAAEKDYKIHSENGKKGGRPKKLTAAATHREAVDVNANGCNPLTADGDIREDSLNVHDTGDRGTLESGTSANIYDQETDQVSTNSPAGAGANLDSTQTNKRPDASDGNAEGVITNGTPITRNGSRATHTSATSGQTFETLDKPGAGEVPPENVSAKPSPALPVPEKRPHGEFGNVMLTTREYTQLCERLDNADSLIEEADGYFEAQPDKKRKYKSHYAMLLNWDRRRKEFEAPAKVQRFKTIDDINQERIAKAKREVYEMFHPGESKAV